MKPSPAPASPPASASRNPGLVAAIGAGCLLGLGLAVAALIVLLRGEVPTGTPDWVKFLGRFHPLLLHLPIGGLAYLMVVEGLRWFRRRSTKPARLPAVAFTALSAALAAALGYLLGTTGDYSQDHNFLPHLRWGLIFAGAMGAALFFASWRTHWKAQITGLGYTASVALASLALGIAGHAGGNLTHGDEYLTAYAPAPIKPLAEKMLGIEAKPPAPSQEELANIPVADREIYTQVVAPLLDTYCYACHSAAMQKGQLRLDSPEAILAGGKEGPSVIPGEPDQSSLIQRMELELEAEGHMPPPDKLQHDAAALAVLRGWIAAGAPTTGTVAEAKLPEEVLTAIGAAPTAGAQALAHGTAEEDHGPSPEMLDRRQAMDPLVAELAGTLGSSSVTFVSRDLPDILVNGFSLGTQISADQVAALEPIAAEVIELNLSQTNFDDQMAAALPTLPRLRRVNLAATAITDAGLANLLGKTPALEHFIGYGTPLTDASLPVLAGLPTLTQAVLTYTQVTPEAAASHARDGLQFTVGIDQTVTNAAEPAPTADPADSANSAQPPADQPAPTGAPQPPPAPPPAAAPAPAA